jgi:isoleucyl-tRNA synthetase
VETVDGGLDRYDANDAARPIEGFVEDLSTWYVRRSRRRFWKSESDADKLAAYQTLHRALVTVAQLLAPFAPFVSEALYRNLTGERSVHLSDFPVARQDEVDEALEEEMARARRAVEAGLAARDAARIKVRQPLSVVALPGEPLSEEIAAIVRDELNVKRVTFGAAEVNLETHITDELRLEGLARELVRNIQSLRKQSGFNIEDRIVTYYEADGQLSRALERNGDYVKAETLSIELRQERPRDLEGVELKVEGEPIWLGLKLAG